MEGSSRAWVGADVCLVLAQRAPSPACDAQGQRRAAPHSDTDLHGAERGLDALPCQLVLPVDGLGVHPEQDVHAVPGPFSDLRWRHAGIAPGGQARVPEVVGAPGYRRAHQIRRERGSRGLTRSAGVAHGPCVGTASLALCQTRYAVPSDRGLQYGGAKATPAFAVRVTKRRPSTPPVELHEVSTQCSDQLRMCGHYPGVFGGAMLELTLLARVAGVGPAGAGFLM